MPQLAHLVITLSKLNEAELKTAENMLMTFASIQNQKDKTANFSFEIVYHRDFVTIFFTVPQKLKAFVKSQLLSTYPMIEVFESRDFLGSIGKRKIYSGEMYQKDSFVFPLKTYVDFDYDELKRYHDTLKPVLSAFSHLEYGDDLVALQIACNSCEKGWYRKGMKGITIAQNMYWVVEKPFLNSYTRQGHFDPLWILIRALHGWRKGKKVTFGQRGTRVSESEHLEEGEAEGTAKYEYSEAAEKLIKKLFRVNIRILIATKKDKAHAEEVYNSISTAMMSLNDPQLGKLEPTELRSRHKIHEFENRLICKKSNIFNSEELASFIHVPLGELEIPKLMWSNFRKLEPPANVSMRDAVMKVGTSNHQMRKIPFGLKAQDILRHVYIIGRTGMGKSTLLENMVHDAIHAGKGVGVIDPHGDLAEKVLNFIPSKRINDVIVFNPSDIDFPISYNIMECKSAEQRSTIASGLVGVFQKIYADSWGPRLEHILRNTILSLLWCKDVSILGIPRMLTDRKFRKQMLKQVEDPILKDFWAKEYEPLQERTRVEWISPILNKVGQFLSNPIIRNILGQVKSKFHLRWAMDNGKILIMNLSKGRIGEDVSTLLGSVMITKFQIEAMSRADIPEKERRDFYLFIDEFQNFATESFATILSEARKYKLALIMANQYVAQMDETVRDAIFGNVGSLISFQVGFEDAEDLMKQFSEIIEEPDLVSLSRGSVYLRLLVDGLPTAPFSATTNPPLDMEIDEERVEKIMKVSREKYGVKREVIEEKIQKWSEEK